MITIGNAISQVRTATRQFTSDVKLTDRDIYYSLLKFAKEFISQQANKLQITEQENLFQPYNCIDIIPVPISDECCKYEVGCKIYRTKEKLPEMFEDSKGVIIRSVTTIDWHSDLTRTTLERWLKISGDPNFKYNKEKYYFLKNGYIYFPNTKYKSVSILGYFLHDVFKSCTECGDTIDCTQIQDKNWRVPGKLERVIIEAVQTDLFNKYMKVVPDESSDKNEKSK